MAHVEFSWVALKPIRAEHPLGSGTEVEYQPGDLVPANDWGQAVHHLEANGKIAQVAVNVLDPEDASGLASRPGGVPGKGLSDPDREFLAYEGQSKKKKAVAEPKLAKEDSDGDEPVTTDESEFPHHLGAGLYELSDGSQVKGKFRAREAQATLTAEEGA